MSSNGYVRNSTMDFTSTLLYSTAKRVKQHEKQILYGYKNICFRFIQVFIYLSFFYLLLPFFNSFYYLSLILGDQNVAVGSAFMFLLFLVMFSFKEEFYVSLLLVLYDFHLRCFYGQWVGSIRDIHVTHKDTKGNYSRSAITT